MTSVCRGARSLANHSDPCGARGPCGTSSAVAEVFSDEVVGVCTSAFGTKSPQTAAYTSSTGRALLGGLEQEPPAGEARGPVGDVLSQAGP